jgi:hypothetical protein
MHKKVNKADKGKINAMVSAALKLPKNSTSKISTSTTASCKA